MLCSSGKVIMIEYVDFRSMHSDHKLSLNRQRALMLQLQWALKLQCMQLKLQTTMIFSRGFFLQQFQIM